MQAAREAKVVTQLGNQGHSASSIRTFCEWIWDGAIGNVHEVHASCDAFPQVYCQINKLPALKEKHEVPAELDWDLWQGPAAERPYHPMYVPFNWRGWTPYGTGCIGDWICHVIDPSFWALDLGAPKTIHADVQGYDPKKHADVYPEGVEITFEFPAKGDRGPVKVVWYDGKCKPPRPADLEEGRNPPGTGAIVLGDEGTITHGSHGAGGVRLIPEAKMQAYKRPEETIPRVPGHQADWLQSIRAGKQAGSNFDYGGPLTELGLLGMIAIRMAGTTLAWDAEAMRFTNCDAANQFVKPTYREGWEI
jgi:predicted dehydrogenase